LTAASDQPSEALFYGLREVLLNLQILSLDPVHLPITYETAHFRKKTDGSRDLRRLMAKFNKLPNSTVGATWGAAYTGTQAVPHSAHEKNLRGEIMDNTMPATVARKVLADVDPNVPWSNSLDFVRALAAFSTVYHHELGRRSHVAGQTLRKLIWNACHPNRIQWYANNIRALHEMGERAASLLASGTSANETMNHEINSWFGNQPDVYATTVRALGKLLAHNSALYCPTTCAMPSSLVLARTVANLAQPQADWRAYTAQVASFGRGVTRPSILPFHQLRQRHAKMISAHKAAVGRGVLKRPSRALVINKLRLLGPNPKAANALRFRLNEPPYADEKDAETFRLQIDGIAGTLPRRGRRPSGFVLRQCL
ncbi:MAG: hypothetical protein GY768_23755, partial [Planctomycetaceae bacterium]|nr:hypothetical protein [Planctomycetaceae bacterium]